MKRPAFQFYPADWRKDPALSSCSLAARGLWIELMCIAHESDEYGHLSINGKPMLTPQLARLVGESPAIIGKLLTELKEAGVFSLDERGCIFSRRMVKDERIRNIRSESGRLGGNPNLLKQKDKQNDQQTQKQIPTPSSSSSSSSSSSDKTSPNGLVAATRKRAAANRPDDVSEPVWQDFQRLRAQRRAPLTDTALAGIRREAGKAGVGLEAALAYCCEHGWQGFNAGWYAQRTGSATGASKSSSHGGLSTKNYSEGVNADGTFV